MNSKLHRDVIKSPRLDLDIDVPVEFLKNAIKEAYGESERRVGT
jgi:hypothetical protein